ncbi:hypothetical protein ZIOFF_051171 [Zingiber officinale]|uniref:Uncharacterized protein n=1 Tax=Zingiber officinale TaxID=94328 RepID=A0A8J5FS60_ZINOF|nr:hypothetical protein ZIOFF_051171 [Zingiber officinale]
MQAYREAVETQWIHYKQLVNSVHQKECETSLCNSIAGEYVEDVYKEEEGEIDTYLLPIKFEDGPSSRLAHKKRKHMRQK